MKAVLHSEAKLWRIAAFGELAIWEDRPELQRLCAIAEERGTLGPGEIEQVLPGLSEAARKNIVRHLTYLRLLDERGAPTGLGRHCTKTGEAPAWELGGYHFLVAQHPLFRFHIIDFRRVPADGKDWDFMGLDDVPEWFGPDPARVWSSAADNNLRFTLSDLPAPRGTDRRCRAEALQPARLVWNVNLETGTNAWHVEGELVGERGATTFRSRPEPVPTQRLAGLFASWDSRWSAKAGRVAMAYDLGAIGGFETFLRTFRYPSVTVGEYGTFSDVVVEDVPVGPSTAAEARDWALALTTARVTATDAYCSKSTWAAEWGASVSGTPLETGAGDAPSPHAITSVCGKLIPVRTRWLLAAPSDLAMD